MRTISSIAKREVQASQTGAVFLTLLQLVHDDITTINLVNNMVDVVFEEVTYTAYPFKFDPPKDSEGNKPGSRIIFPNIDRQFLSVIRSISDPLTVRAALIMILPDNSASKEGGWWEYTMLNVSYDMMNISGDLEYNLDLDNNASVIKYSNLIFPGLYG